MNQEENEEIQSRVLAVLNVEGKVEAVRRLAAVHRRLSDLLVQLEEVQREYGVEHVAAVRAGMSEQELKKLGYAEPSRRPKGRPRGSGRAGERGARAEEGAEQQAGSGADVRGGEERGAGTAGGGAPGASSMTPEAG